MMNNLGLYVHIPFCDQKCHYCDFTSYCRKTSDGMNYLEALEKELLGFQDRLLTSQVETIYIGGGTPSSLTMDETECLLSLLKPYAKEVKEWTIEANPESVSSGKVELWHAFGINRVSLGVQSLDERWLKRLGRIHTKEKVSQAVDLIKQHFSNLNLDLIYGLSDVDETYLSSLSQMITLEPQHLSIYELEVYDHLPLGQMLHPSIDSDSSYEQFHRLRNLLEDHGFLRYEVSNFAKPGFESQHNQRYWLRQNTLGVGLAAHSLLDNRRLYNTSDFSRYLQGHFLQDSETLTEKDALIEEIMLGFRLVKGIELNSLLIKYPTQRHLIETFVARQTELGRLVFQGERIAPTTIGLDLLDRVVLDFMSL